MNKIVIFGGSGLVGKELTEVLAIHEYQIVIVTRNIEKTKAEFSVLDFQDLISFVSITDEVAVIQAMNDSTAVINLAGANLFGKRWTKAYKQELFESRIGITKQIVSLISKTKIKPKTLISGSAIGYYGSTLSDKILNEKSPSGFDFLSQLCTAWENEANKASVSRIINMRTGIVLSEEGGAMERLKKSYKFRVGTYFKPGFQYFSWIHIEDLTYAILECIENKKLKGAINFTSPNPVTNLDLAKGLREVYEAKILIPIPPQVTKIVLGEFSEGLVKGQRVIPQKLIDSRFAFKYPELLSALKSIK